MHWVQLISDTISCLPQENSFHSNQDWCPDLFSIVTGLLMLLCSSTTSLFKFINVQAMKTFQKARSLNSCKGARFVHRGWELFNLISLFHLYKCFWNTQLSNFKSIKSSQLGSLVRNRKRFTGPQFIPSYPPSVRKLQKFFGKEMFKTRA